MFPKYSLDINSEVAEPGPAGGITGGEGAAAWVEDTIGFGLGVIDCFHSGAIFFKYSKQSIEAFEVGIKGGRSEKSNYHELK